MAEDGVPNPAEGGKGQEPNSPPEPALVAGTPEYSARMQAIGKGEPDPYGQVDALGLEGNVEERPGWLQEKFWDGENKKVMTEELAKSYGQLEGKLGGGESKPGDEGSGDATPPTPPTMDKPMFSDEDGVSEIATKAGLDPMQLGKDFVESGSLSDDQFAALGKVLPGVPKNIMNDFMQTQVDKAQAATNAINDMSQNKAGGQDQLDNLLEWGLKSLAKDDITWYNKAVTGTDPGEAERAVDWLVAKHKTAIGAGDAQALVEGTGPGQSATPTFGNEAELSSAMMDQRYDPVLPNGIPNPNYDPAYRGAILRKMQKSFAADTMSHAIN